MPKIVILGAQWAKIPHLRGSDTPFMSKKGSKSSGKPMTLMVFLIIFDQIVAT